MLTVDRLKDTNKNVEINYGAIFKFSLYRYFFYFLIIYRNYQKNMHITYNYKYANYI